MFKPLFSAMNEVLDDILHEYPTAYGPRKTELDQQLDVLKAMNDDYIEEWLSFEEKLSQLYRQHAPSSSQHQEWNDPYIYSEDFRRGQGYYKLFMFNHAIREFEKLVFGQADSILARVYLAMSYLRNEQLDEAAHQFQFIISLTENQAFLAASYNALGCIQAKRGNKEQACEYFKMALDADATYQEPMLNIEACAHPNGEFVYGLGTIH